MSTDATRALIDAFVEAVNRKDVDALDGFLTDDFSIPPGDSSGMSAAVLKEVLKYYYRAFPDLRYAVAQVICEGDAAAVHLHMTGTHRGEYQGVAGNGTRFAVEEVDLMKFRDGKIAGYRIIWDEIGFRRQLGLL